MVLWFRRLMMPPNEENVLTTNRQSPYVSTRSAASLFGAPRLAPGARLLVISDYPVLVPALRPNLRSRRPPGVWEAERDREQDRRGKGRGRPHVVPRPSSR